MSSDLYSELGVVTEESVAILLNKKLGSLRNDRAMGVGPPFIKDGKTILYPVAKLRAWLATKTITPSASAATLINTGKRRRRRAS